MNIDERIEEYCTGTRTVLDGIYKKHGRIPTVGVYRSAPFEILGRLTGYVNDLNLPWRPKCRIAE